MFENNNRNSMEYDNSRITISGKNGAYQQKAYNAEIKILYRFEGIELREVENNTAVNYELLWDDEVLSRYSTLKMAIKFFIDFAGITKAKLNKLAVA